MSLGCRRRALVRAVPLLCGLLVAGGCAGLPFGDPPPAWELPPPPPPSNPVVKPGRLHRAELDNGLRVIVLEDPRLPRVGLTVTLPRGEAALGPSDAGLASYTAELLERGAGERDALEFARSVERLGASVGAGAGWDSLEVRASGLSRDLDFLIDTLADMLLRPRFDPAEARRAQGELLQSLERAKDDPATLESWNGARALYAGHRYGLPLAGSPETVAALDAAAARAYHDRTFVAEGAILSVSGDVDAEQLLPRLRAAFGGWERGVVPPAGEPPPARVPAERTIVVVDRPDLVQARIFVGHEGIERTAPDRLAVQLLNSVLGGAGFSSRLMESLRTESGLTYGVYSGFALRRAPGPFFVSLATAVENARLALDALLGELERAREQPPGEDELSWARTLAAGRFSMGLETSAAVTAGLVDLEVYDLPRDSLDTYRARVRATTDEQVAAAAQARLHPDRAAIVLVGPADALTGQLAGLGPVEVVTP
jgi:predicted Zn-dependent peptidase